MKLSGRRNGEPQLRKKKPLEPEFSELEYAARILLRELREFNRACGKWPPNPRSLTIEYLAATMRFLAKFGDKTTLPSLTMYQMMFEELPPLLPDWIRKRHSDMRSSMRSNMFSRELWQPQVIDGDKDKA